MSDLIGCNTDQHPQFETICVGQWKVIATRLDNWTKCASVRACVRACVYVSMSVYVIA